MDNYGEITPEEVSQLVPFVLECIPSFLEVKADEQIRLPIFSANITGKIDFERLQESMPHMINDKDRFEFRLKRSSKLPTDEGTVKKLLSDSIIEFFCTRFEMIEFSDDLLKELKIHVQEQIEVNNINIFAIFGYNYSAKPPHTFTVCRLYHAYQSSKVMVFGIPFRGWIMKDSTASLLKHSVNEI